MKRVFLCIFLVFFSLCLVAQNYKMIKGIVRDSSGKGLASVSVAAIGTSLVFSTDSKGAFVAYVPQTVKQFRFSKKGYLSKIVDATGYLIVSLSKDPQVAKASRERKAQQLAIEAETARQDSLDAVAEKERISAEIKKEVDEAMTKRKDTILVRETTEKVIVREVAPTPLLQKRSRFSCKLDFCYTAQIAQDDVVFENSGIQKFGNLSPLSLEFAFYYNIGKYSSLGLGIGGSYALSSMYKTGDRLAHNLYGDGYVEKRFDLPIYVDGRFVFGKSSIRPVVSISGGVYAITTIPLGRISAGCQFMYSKKIVPFIDLILGTTPFPYFSETDKNAGYRTAFGVSVKAGIVL